jgi:SAM-dependent methyltransferase
MEETPRERYARLLPASGVVLDVGCWNYSFQRFCAEIGVHQLVHFGVDRERPPERAPVGYTFERVDLDGGVLPFDDGKFDGVVLSHVVEHLSRPLALLDEAFRVLKPGGVLYIECPSERSLWIPSMPFKFAESRSLNFYDDPTHIGRPQTPQSLHRLFRMYDAEVIDVSHITSRAVQIRFLWLIAKALYRRDAAMLEQVMWRAVGYAVFGIARSSGNPGRHYVLSA